MTTLNNRYVLHIPTFKYVNTEDKTIIGEEYIKILTDKLTEYGYTSFYITQAQGQYKTRKYDEILITVYASDNRDAKLPDTIFGEWFRKHNHIFEQESFAYEHNNKLYIEKL